MATTKATRTDTIIENPRLSYEDIRRLLLEPVPKHLISYRPVKQGAPPTIAYINVTDYKDLMDARAGIWESHIVDFRQVGNSMACVVRVTIHAEDGSFSHDGSGIEAMEIRGYGDPFSNSFAQAFRRACEGHGLSRELWRSAESNENFQREQMDATTANQNNDPSPAPPANNVAPLVDYFGKGTEAGKKEAKLKEVCSGLNKVGDPYIDSKDVAQEWSAKILNECALAEFDTPLNKLDKGDVAVLLTDLSDRLEERLAMQGKTSPDTSAKDSTPSHSGPEMATEQQVNALRKLCDIKGKVESEIAGKVSNDRVGTFTQLTEKEAEDAIKTITKM